MDTLHDKMSQNYKWYQDWHTRGGYEFIHWLTFILVAVVAWSVVSSQTSDWMLQVQTGQLTMQVPNTQAVISLTPPTHTAKKGEIFAIDIFLNTNTGPIDAIDIYGLHYDPTILEVVDDLPDQKGVQILPGDLFPNTAVDNVDASTGTIKLAQFSNGGQTYTGRGVLATVHFKALSVGSSYLKFDFSSGSTVDTNAAHLGRDKLVNVVDGIYTVTSN